MLYYYYYYYKRWRVRDRETGMRLTEKKNWLYTQGGVHRKERLVIHNDDVVGGPHTQMKERVLPACWWQMKLCRYEGWIIWELAFDALSYFKPMKTAYDIGQVYGWIQELWHKCYFSCDFSITVIFFSFSYFISVTITVTVISNIYKLYNQRMRMLQ